MHEIIEWVKRHPYLTGGLGLAILILIIIYKNSQSNAAAQQTQSTAVPGQSDAITALQIQSGAAIGQATIAANAQIAGYQAQQNITALTTNAAQVVDTQQINAQLEETLAGAGVANYQTYGALTLGLAQLGYAPPGYGPGTGSVGGNNPGTPTGTPVTTGSMSPQLPATNPAPSGGVPGSNPIQNPNGITTYGYETSIPGGQYGLPAPYGAPGYSGVSGYVPNVPLPTAGEDYNTYQAAVIAAAGSGNCGPQDFTCIATQTAVQNAVNQNWTQYEYGGAGSTSNQAPTTPVYAPSVPTAPFNNGGNIPPSGFVNGVYNPGGSAAPPATPTSPGAPGSAAPSLNPPPLATPPPATVGRTRTGGVSDYAFAV